MTAFYLLFILLWFGLWLAVGDGYWWLTMINRFVPVLFIPAIFFFLVALIRRKLTQAVLAAVPLFIFIWLYRPFFQPQWKPETEPVALRVMSYNVLYSNQASRRVAAIIQDYQPGLVALQEVQPEMMAQLQDRLREVYPYSLMATPNPYGTTAIFSQHPFLERQVLDLGDGRPATLVTIAKNGRPITFAAVHLRAYGLQWVPPLQIPAAINEQTDLQNQQVRILLQALSNREGAVIIGFDCNSKETSSSFRMLNAEMKSASYSNGCRLFYNPLQGTRLESNINHIDYIFYRGKYEPTGTYLIQNSGGSDHQPLLAEFSLP